MDIKEIIQWALHRWWWFVISVAVCLLMVGYQILTKTPAFEVRATLMLRHVSESSDGPDEMMQMMGFRDNKVTGDEVKVLTSRDLVGRVVDELDLCATYAKKDGFKWWEQFPQHDLTAKMDYTFPQMVTVDVKVCKDGYLVKVKRYHKWTERYKLNNLSKPIQTAVGELSLNLCDTISKGTFRAVIVPRNSTVDMLIRQLSVTRLARESNVITLSTVTNCPKRMEATINTLIKFYNQESTMDKNLLAIQTEQFLADRIRVIEQELTDVEAAIENYKRNQKIADLRGTAYSYKQIDVSYEQRIAEVDATLRLVDYVSEQVSNPEAGYTMLPQVSNSEVVNLCIKDYNKHVDNRDKLLQTATEQNYAVVKKNELLDQKKLNIKETLAQERKTLLLRKQELLNQQNEFANRLSSIPQTERHYLELCREKETKEKQYVYLIEKREENAMLLSSEAIPARIVENAQQNSEVASPKPKKMAMMAVILGLLLPFVIYVFEWFRKTYL